MSQPIRKSLHNVMHRFDQPHCKRDRNLNKDDALVGWWKYACSATPGFPMYELISDVEQTQFIHIMDREKVAAVRPKVELGSNRCCFCSGTRKSFFFFFCCLRRFKWGRKYRWRPFPPPSSLDSTPARRMGRSRDPRRRRRRDVGARRRAASRRVSPRRCSALGVSASSMFCLYKVTSLKEAALTDKPHSSDSYSSIRITFLLLQRFQLDFFRNNRWVFLNYYSCLLVRTVENSIWERDCCESLFR